MQQREVWRVDYPRAGNGGALTTGGKLVFQGSVDGMFNAYAADTGARLWSQDAQNAILGGPITFELDGEQYVAALAGLGGVAMGGGLGRRAAAQPVRSRARVQDRRQGSVAGVEANVARLIPDVRRANARRYAAGQRQLRSRVLGVSRRERAQRDGDAGLALLDALSMRRRSSPSSRRRACGQGHGGICVGAEPVDAEAVRAWLVHMALARKRRGEGQAERLTSPSFS